MSWRGSALSIEEAARRAERARLASARPPERDAARKRRALQSAMEREACVASARGEYELFANYLDLIVSLHKELSDESCWHDLANCQAPASPSTAENAALASLRAHRPSLLDRIFGNDKKQRAVLEEAVLAARSTDLAQHRAMMQQWEWHRSLARGVLERDPAAYETAIAKFSCFDELEELGMQIDVRIHSGACTEITIWVLNAELVPTQELKLLASGKASSKEMPKTRYWGLYQDCVCSAALRVAREIFALLPVDVAFVNVARIQLNSATGHDENVPILSAAFDRNTFSALNFARLDPSDAVEQFTHRMSFKKSLGFERVEPLDARSTVL